MTMFVFAALTVVALVIAWGTVAVALRQSPQDQIAIEEPGEVPDWSVTPAQVRMW
jgi:hypothetical protein